MKYSWGSAVLPLLLFSATILPVNADIIGFQKSGIQSSKAVATVDLENNIVNVWERCLHCKCCE